MFDPRPEAVAGPNSRWQAGTGVASQDGERLARELARRIRAEDGLIGQDMDNNIFDEPISKAVGDRYLQYALSTIMNRALPDARDGLKPVHRRILYAMRELKLGANGGFRKSAKISGDVMGNFHPHGDQAIYDALARLAQDFNLRYPLIDGQGNFGSIDGDNPAAARYTEARLTLAAEALLDGLNEDAVDFRPNYDGTLSEPIVLPAAFPNLLANGASGIAVGMATNIPPHNVGELCDACLFLISNPNARETTLATKLPGPDFPTGGVIVDSPEQIQAAYVTGRGTFRVRAKWNREKAARGQWCIIVTELPYQVQKSKLIERIAVLIQDRMIPALLDVRDESAEDVRIVLEPKSRKLDPAALMEALFKSCDLEARFSLNMNALIDGQTPRVCSLKDILAAFLEHRREVLVRRSQYRLDRIDERLELLEGFLVSFLNLDRVIEIIRFGDDPQQMLEDEFALSERQAEAILNMRLRNLRRLEEMKLRNERDELLIERSKLEDLLGEAELQWKRVREEIKDIKARFGSNSPGGARRTRIELPPEVAEMSPEDLIEREPITVLCSKLGWVRALKGSVPADQEFKFRDGDAGRFVFPAETTDRLLIFATDGRFFTLRASALPGGRSLGDPLRIYVDLPESAGIVTIFPHVPGRMLLLASKAGYGFRVAENDIVAATRNGRHVMSLRDLDEACCCVPITGSRIAVVGKNRRLLVFPVEDMPILSRGKGIRLQKYSDGQLADVTTFDPQAGLQWSDPAGRCRTTRDFENWQGRRGSSGRKVPRGFPRSGTFS